MRAKKPIAKMSDKSEDRIMNFYIICDKDCYTLFPQNEYSMGRNSDIYLDILKVYTVNVEADKITLDNKEYKPGVHNVKLETANIKIIILKKEDYYLIDKKDISIGFDDYCDIKCNNSNIEFFLSLEDMELVSSKEYFVNGRLSEKQSIIRMQDVIVFDIGVSLCIIDNILVISSVFDIETGFTELERLPQKEDRRSDFHRSPRIILKEPDTKVSIAQPPTNEESNKQNLWKIIIAPLAMIAFTVVTYMLSAGGGMMIMMMGMSVITIITSLHSYFDDKKKTKERQKRKLEDYKKYLDEKYVSIYGLKKEQQESMNYHYPDMQSIMDMSKNTDRRIYEKTVYDFDYLTYRLGSGFVKPSFKIDYSEAELSKYNEEASKKVKALIAHYNHIENMPIKSDLMVPVGYIGDRKILIEQVQQLMMQIALFHSYHDIIFIPIFREEELKLWSWCKYLPHMKIKELNMRSFIYDQKSRDQILTALYQIIKERKADEESEKSKEKIYSPRYILFIMDLSLLLDHNIMEYINEDLSKIGISYVFTGDVIESLPEHVKTVVSYKGEKSARLMLKNKDFVNVEFQPLKSISIEEKLSFASSLAAVTHVQTLRNSIPDSVTFLEMYGVKKVEELNILNKWNINDTYKTMSVPLGLRGKDDVLYLNLHEKAHGPHGLIAGTTGSGKSELVQSYILSLAVNFHPYEIAFLLIDYKGGGMANLFKELPHLVGTITNLDANQANRALVSIKAELKKRQRVFAENDVNHINQYSKLFKEGKVSSPMPHLFIISDEFAELKAEQPDFMKELVSTARIGRSLGIHLILATQKPSGVVNDQIWSNSKFKIALKVQDIADSREIIKTPDAAHITQTGRAYLQVGNNEIYELFQSAWSGADYDPDQIGVKKENIVYEITDNGQYRTINSDLSGLEGAKKISSVPTELDVIVKLCAYIFNAIGIEKVPSPWLEPLKEVIYTKEIESTDFKYYWESEEGYEILLGYIDRPDRQLQEPLYIKPENAGHILVVSSPGFGKSTFLQSFAMNIIRKNRPDKAHFYLYDFGNSGLVALSDFPHVADYFTMDEDEKIKKSIRILTAVIKERKRILGESKHTNLSRYNESSENKLESIFILIDGFDALNDLKFSDLFNELLNTVARDGVALGIYIVATMSRINSMRLQLQANFKTKIAMYLFDKSDLSNIVGRSNITIEEIRGRAVIKLDEISIFQVTLPYEYENYSDYIAMIKEEVKAMNSIHKGNRAIKIPMLPEKLSKNNFMPYIDLSDNSSFVLGLYSESVSLAKFSLNKSFMLTSDNIATVGNYLALVEFNKEIFGYKLLILDPTYKIAKNRFPGVDRFNKGSDIENVSKTILEDLKKRIDEPDKDYPSWIVIIPDIVNFISNSAIKEADYKLLITEGAKYGVTLAFVGLYSDLVTSYDSNVRLSKQLVEQVFIGMRISDQDHTRYPYISNEPYLKPVEGHILRPEGYEKVMIVSGNE